jgi:hypothetical protein
MLCCICGITGGIVPCRPYGGGNRVVTEQVGAACVCVCAAITRFSGNLS